MNQEQKEAVEMVKESWAKSGTVYMDIIETEDAVYMILNNGTAYAIYPDGRRDWVIISQPIISMGRSIVERPCKDMVYVIEAGDFYCDNTMNCCPGTEECNGRKE